MPKNMPSSFASKIDTMPTEYFVHESRVKQVNLSKNAKDLVSTILEAMIRCQNEQIKQLGLKVPFVENSKVKEWGYTILFFNNLF